MNITKKGTQSQAADRKNYGCLQGPCMGSLWWLHRPHLVPCSLPLTQNMHLKTYLLNWTLRPSNPTIGKEAPPQNGCNSHGAKKEAPIQNLVQALDTRTWIPITLFSRTHWVKTWLACVPRIDLPQKDYTHSLLEKTLLPCTPPKMLMTSLFPSSMIWPLYMSHKYTKINLNEELKKKKKKKTPSDHSRKLYLLKSPQKTES